MINPYNIVKYAGISPGTATLAAMGVGGGIGYLIDKLNSLGDKPTENSWKNPLLGAILAGLPPWTYGAVRSSWAFDGAGNSSMSLWDRWFTDDDTFWKDPLANYNWENYLKSKQKYYNPDRVKSGEWVDTMGSIPVNAFNETTWVDASRGRTPMEAAGYVTSTLNQTGRRVGSNFVTPGQVMNTMVNAGIGYGTAWLAGKTLGALAGVTPETQKKLCEIGTWGGMLGGISNAAQHY